MATATSGGLKELWVTQFTVPDATSSPFFDVRMKSPYGIIRRAFFLASSSIVLSFFCCWGFAPDHRFASRSAIGTGRVVSVAIQREAVEGVDCLGPQPLLELITHQLVQRL